MITWHIPLTPLSGDATELCVVVAKSVSDINEESVYAITVNASHSVPLDSGQSKDPSMPEMPKKLETPQVISLS